ncbi:MAG: histidine kinase N-terminal 7TM domain-containing protein [Anaerolineales bacterium]
MNLLSVLQTINQLLAAGIAITAFSLLLYALTFNLKDRVARSFAFIMACVVVVYVGESVADVVSSPRWIEVWYQVQWIGIIFLPPAYVLLSDAVLATTGRPSRGRRTKLIKIAFGISVVFLATIPFFLLVGPLVTENVVAPHLQRTNLTWVFSVFYILCMIWAWVNFQRAFHRTVTSSGQRRMAYLIGGALAPALGSFPYLLFGSNFASGHPYVFWLAAVVSNILVSGLIVIMAYAVAFFGVSWPDRVIKRRLTKWVLRGPVTASSVLALTTITRRAGEPYSLFAPVVMAGVFLLMQYFITMFSPIWERWFLLGESKDSLILLQNLEERLFTLEDLRQFLESVLAAICDRLQTKKAFAAALTPTGLDFLVTVGGKVDFEGEELAQRIQGTQPSGGKLGAYDLFSWGSYWIIPIFNSLSPEDLLGLIGVEVPEKTLYEEEREAFRILLERVQLALEDRIIQQSVFSSIEEITPQMDRIQQLRAAARYDGTTILTADNQEVMLDEGTLTEWVRDALSDYWGGPDLSESPLLQLEVVQNSLDEHDGVSVKAVRAILREAIEKIRPEGTRRFTLDWVLYNILEMKFLKGQKVRDVAKRLAMSEANLYRKQKIAIEVVAKTILEMEKQAREEKLEPREKA